MKKPKKKRNPDADLDREVHVLAMRDLGITARMRITESGIHCEWTPAPPFGGSKADRVLRRYVPWRNDIIQRWAEKKGIGPVLVVNV